MLRLSLVSACLWLADATLASAHHPTHSPAAIATSPADEKPLKALDAWLKLYRTGKINYLSKQEIGKDSIAARFGLVAKDDVGGMTWSKDLHQILEAVAKLDTAEAAQALLDVCAVGFDPGEYTYSMAPYEVRAAGERWTETLTSVPAKDEVARAVRGELKVEKARAAAIQAAAVRSLGKIERAAATRTDTYRQTIEQQLGDGDEIVRLHAAEALGWIADESSAMALIAALERDTSDAVVGEAALALDLIYKKYLPAVSAEASKPAEGEPAADGADKKPVREPAAKVAGDGAAPPAAPAPSALPESARLAVRSATRALGRTTWRADIHLLALLDDFRSTETVPALIGILERFRDHPQEIQSGKLSGLLLVRAHDLLVSMTGGVFGPDQPEKWRELWERDKDTIEVTQKRPPKRAGQTVSGGFCGIPVEGTRVIFILDLSGSMNWATKVEKNKTGLDYAKRELHRAMDSIAPNALFNLITFNGNPKAKAWNEKLVVANEKNRERFRKFVDGLDADGGTNLWASLEEALKLKSQSYGERYDSNADEMFILSDGAPSVGEIRDPTEILRLVKESNRLANMRINTIYLNTETPPEHRQPMPWMTMKAEDFLQERAASSCCCDPSRPRSRPAAPPSPRAAALRAQATAEQHRPRHREHAAEPDQHPAGAIGRIQRGLGHLGHCQCEARLAALEGERGAPDRAPQEERALDLVPQVTRHRDLTVQHEPRAQQRATDHDAQPSQQASHHGRAG
jgi:uncharacterized protein YegL